MRSLRVLGVWAVVASGAVGPGTAADPPTSPAGGEKWAAGSSHWITWPVGSRPRDERIRLEFSADGGRTWSAVAAVPNTGRYLWTVPDAPTRDGRVRLTAGGDTAASAAFVVVPSQARTYRWTNVTRKAAFAPRDGAGALVFRDRMWLLGGWNPADKTHFPRTCNNEVWSSADGRDWRLEKLNTFRDRSFDPAADWEGRHTAGYAVFRDKMWVVGGDVNQGHYHADVWASANGKKWEHANRSKPVPWGPRALHYTVVHRDRIWVLGGQTVPQFAAAPEVFYRDVWTSADGVEWTQVKPREPFWPQRGMIGGAAVFRDRIWVLGGGTYDTPKIPDRKFYNDVWSSEDGVGWTRHVEQAPWEPRQYHEVAVFDDRLWVLEGYHPAGNRKDVWYSADGVNWYEVPATPWKPRHAAGVYTFQNALWVVAGNNMESDVWKLERD